MAEQMTYDEELRSLASAQRSGRWYFVFHPTPGLRMHRFPTEASARQWAAFLGGAWTVAGPMTVAEFIRGPMAARRVPA